jgi:hypothetical protein
VQNRIPGDRDPEVLSEPTAARLLARASELDEARRAGSTVADLRAVAAEAGISAPAFDAALEEVRVAEQERLSDVRHQRPRRSRTVALAVAGMLAIVLVSRMLFPASGASEPSAPAGQIRSVPTATP